MGKALCDKALKLLKGKSMSKKGKEEMLKKLTLTV